MWDIYDIWAIAMRGAGLYNYANEILEKKANHFFEYSRQLSGVMENTWLVNRWGVKGRSIPTDLYLEHNNGTSKV